MTMKARGVADGKGALARRTTRAPRGVQYTVRDVPRDVDAALRRRARDEGRSLNQIVCEVLAREAGLDPGAGTLHHDLDGLAGRWEEDPDFDAAIAAQDRIDDELWR